MPEDNKGLGFIIGGARSGKSAHAEMLVRQHPAPWTYIATAQAFDDEMAERIAIHKERRGEGWRTIEAPLELADALGAIADGETVLVDCLTLWLTNHLLAGSDLGAESANLVRALSSPRGPCYVVSNEVGLGIVPDNELSRRFRDAAGRLNQEVAAVAESVVFTVAGLPLKVK